jgi:uncharacterized membrane protein YeiH
MSEAVLLAKIYVNLKYSKAEQKHTMTSANIANIVVTICAMTKGWRRPVCVHQAYISRLDF